MLAEAAGNCGATEELRFAPGLLVGGLPFVEEDSVCGEQEAKNMEHVKAMDRVATSLFLIFLSHLPSSYAFVRLAIAPTIKLICNGVDLGWINICDQQIKKAVSSGLSNSPIIGIIVRPEY